VILLLLLSIQPHLEVGQVQRKSLLFLSQVMPVVLLLPVQQPLEPLDQLFLDQLLGVQFLVFLIQDVIPPQF
jgi:hypothetical protein